MIAIEFPSIPLEISPIPVEFPLILSDLFPNVTNFHLVPCNFHRTRPVFDVAAKLPAISLQLADVMPQRSSGPLDLPTILLDLTPVPHRFSDLRVMSFIGNRS